MAPITVCLCMIVGNEQAIIERCLNSAKFLIDYVSISYNGKDATKDKIEAWCTENKIPLKMHYETWDHFSHNRTHALKCAHESFPKATWLLLLDADMVLVNRGFKREELVLDAYYIDQTENGSTYSNIRLVRNSIEWKSECFTHEFTTPARPCKARVGFNKTLWIDDRSDGGSKADKHDRDIKLIRRGMVEDKPANRPRYMFYLASTYFSMNQYSDAIYWFNERVNQPDGQFEEEMWYSYFRMGLCYEKFNDNAKAVYYFMLAINRRPWRLEPYGHLAKLWINKKPYQYHNAYTLLKEGLKYGYPEKDILFIEDKWYHYEANFWLACSCFFLNNAIEGRIISQRLLQDKKTPAFVKENIQEILSNTNVKPTGTATATSNDTTDLYSSN